MWPHRRQPTRLPVPGILQARTLEWVAISFSNAWKWKVKVKSLSRVRLSDPMDCSLPGSSIHGTLQARVLEWGAIAFSDLSHTSPQIISFNSHHNSTIQELLFVPVYREGNWGAEKSSHLIKWQDQDLNLVLWLWRLRSWKGITRSSVPANHGSSSNYFPSQRRPGKAVFL